MSETEPCPQTYGNPPPIEPDIQNEETIPGNPLTRLPTIEDIKEIGRGRQRLNQYGYYRATRIIQQNPQLRNTIGLNNLEAELALSYYRMIIESGQHVNNALEDIEQSYAERGLTRNTILRLMLRFRRKISEIAIQPSIIHLSQDSPAIQKQITHEHLGPLPLPEWYGDWIAKLTSDMETAGLSNKIQEDSRWITKNNRLLAERSIKKRH